MLNELRVENLLLIERAELRLTSGLNVLTGETGAGKTMLAHALDLLLGGKARPGIVRPGAREAYVEGVFDLPDALRQDLADRLPEGAEEVVLARRVSSEGRTGRCCAAGTVSVGELRDVAAALLSFYGQHEHRKLTLASAQLELLDGFCGDKHVAARAAVGQVFARVRALEGSLTALRERAGAATGSSTCSSSSWPRSRRPGPTWPRWRRSRPSAGRLRHSRRSSAPRRGGGGPRRRGRRRTFAGPVGRGRGSQRLSGAQGALDGVAAWKRRWIRWAARLRALAVGPTTCRRAAPYGEGSRASRAG
jgi:DNA repair protein RecN (Recombination protein N)